MRLYHGSDRAISEPSLGFNTGFADLGYGFYLTDDADVARQRARSRARRSGSAAGVVSVFAFDEQSVPWACWGAEGPQMPQGTALAGPFGLCFEETPAGIAAWARYIKACRAGETAAGELGNPAVVRAWIATEEVEMACSGMVSAEDLGAFLDPSELVVQYCLLDQGLIDAHLSFVEAWDVRSRE